MDYTEIEFEDFFTSYMETALWSSVGGGEEGEITDDHDLSDISDELKAYMKECCEHFLSNGAAALIDAETNPPVREGRSTYEMAGYYFWLNHNGHGAGFGDGDWSDNGDELTEKSKEFSTNELYVGDDGMIYGTCPKLNLEKKNKPSP